MAFARLLLVGLVAGCASVAAPPAPATQSTDPRTQPSPALPPPESLALGYQSSPWMKETDAAEGAEKMQHGTQGGMNMPGMDAPQMKMDAPRQDQAGQHMHHPGSGGMKMEKPMHGGMKMDKPMPGGMKMDKPMPGGMKMPEAGQAPARKEKMKQHDGMEMQHDGLEKAIEKTLEQQTDGGEMKQEGHR